LTVISSEFVEGERSGLEESNTTLEPEKIAANLAEAFKLVVENSEGINSEDGIPPPTVAIPLPSSLGVGSRLLISQCALTDLKNHPDSYRVQLIVPKSDEIDNETRHANLIGAQGKNPKWWENFLDQFLEDASPPKEDELKLETKQRSIQAEEASAPKDNFDLQTTQPSCQAESASQLDGDCIRETSSQLSHTGIEWTLEDASPPKEDELKLETKQLSIQAEEASAPEVSGLQQDGASPPKDKATKSRSERMLQKIRSASPIKAIRSFKASPRTYDI